MRAYKVGKCVYLISREGLDWSKKFPAIVKELSSIKESFFVDGEIVVFDREGKPDFESLQANARSGKADAHFMVFDLLKLRRRSFLSTPLLQRKNHLKQFLSECNLKRVKYVEHFDGDDGEALLKLASKYNLEGIVSKKVDSFYDSVRNNKWLKIKLRSRAKAFISGVKVDSDGKIEHAIVALDGRVIARAEFGLSSEVRKKLYRRIPRNNSSQKNGEVILFRELVTAEISFLEITKSGMLREAAVISVEG